MHKGWEGKLVGLNSQGLSDVKEQMLRIDDDCKYFLAETPMRFDVDSNASSVVSKAKQG
jgi:hypothetical protein